MTVALASCGGDDTETAAPAGGNPPPVGGNAAPMLAGSPPTITLQGRSYSFRPSATDADGEALSFSIDNRPAWASFNAATGRLSGTPSAADVGTFAAITISVTDGRASTSLPAFAVNVVAVAGGSATLSWTPPTQNTDGTPLRDLSGYRVRFGTQAGDYANAVSIANPGLTAYTIDQLTPATWHFVVTAVNANGVESSSSNAASKSIR
jgi:hypothetical protein